MKDNLERNYWQDILQINKGIHPIELLGRIFPQLTLEVMLNGSSDETYLNIVRRGSIPKITKPRNFHYALGDKLWLQKTYVGEVLVLYLEQRDDFERFLQIISYRTEPQAIPPSMGASLIRGIINWRKIEKYKEAYIKKGHVDWAEEFKRFTCQKSNYQDKLIVLSKGAYSGVKYHQTPYDEKTWLDISFKIRLYHECTHLIFFELSKEKNALWEELLADCMGMIYAIQKYDAHLAAVFLGVEDVAYRKGGRLENYLHQEKQDIVDMKGVKNSIDLLDHTCNQMLEQGLLPEAILLSLIKQGSGSYLNDKAL